MNNASPDNTLEERLKTSRSGPWSMEQLYTRLAVAERAARAAGAVLLQYRGRVAVEHKSGPADLVTAADRAAERVVIDALHAVFPDDRIVGEESGALAGGGPHRWFIDPLDGTTNFAQGLPIFSVSIGLERDGQLMLGVVYAPVMGAMYSAVRGGGAWCNGRPLHVSTTDNLADSLLGTGVAADLTLGGRTTLRHMETFSETTRGVRILGSAALHLAFVAEGSFDAYWAPDNQAWDVAAGALLVQEAGGTVTDMEGLGLDLLHPRILATNGAVHGAMISALRRD